jgi:heme/copper-type cytochrome/quinol oxidase subunit 2
MIPGLLLREAIFWIAAALCLIAEIAILRSMFRGSRIATPDRSPAVDAEVPRGRPVTEVIWAVLPAVGLIVILTLTWGAIR